MGSLLQRPQTTASYRRLEVAYRELQAAHSHLRSTQSRLTYTCQDEAAAFHRELLHLADRVDRATSEYQRATQEYVEATCLEPRPSAGPAAASGPAHPVRRA